MTAAKLLNTSQDFREAITRALLGDSLSEHRSQWEFPWIFQSLFPEGLGSHELKCDGNQATIHISRDTYFGGNAGEDVRSLLRQFGVKSYSERRPTIHERHERRYYDHFIVRFKMSDFVRAILPVMEAETGKAKREALQAMWDERDRYVAGQASNRVVRPGRQLFMEAILKNESANGKKAKANGHANGNGESSNGNHGSNGRSRS